MGSVWFCQAALLFYYNLDNLGELANKMVMNFHGGHKFRSERQIANPVFDPSVCASVV